MAAPATHARYAGWSKWRVRDDHRLSAQSRVETDQEPPALGWSQPSFTRPTLAQECSRCRFTRLLIFLVITK